MHLAVSQGISFPRTTLNSDYFSRISSQIHSTSQYPILFSCEISWGSCPAGRLPWSGQSWLHFCGTKESIAKWAVLCLTATTLPMSRLDSPISMRLILLHANHQHHHVSWYTLLLIVGVQTSRGCPNVVLWGKQREFGSYFLNIDPARIVQYMTALLRIIIVSRRRSSSAVLFSVDFRLSTYRPKCTWPQKKQN